MDPDYDSTEAKIMLEKAYAESEIDVKESTALKDFDSEKYRVVFVEQPRSWRIVSKDDAYDSEEQTFHLHGIVCNSDLPPLRIKLNDAAQGKAKFLRQSIQITGLGTQSFDRDMSVIEEIHSMMLLHLQRETIGMRPWQSNIYEGYRAVDASARYFTQRKFVPMEAGLPFEKGVDPNGILARLRKGDLIHAMDNKVDYLTRYKSRNDGDSSMKRIEPKDIAIGDVVQITASFVGYMNKDQSVSMTVLLKAITLIASLGKPLATSRGDTGLAAIPRIITIKRKRVYDEESNARRKLERMSLTEDSSPAL